MLELVTLPIVCAAIPFAVAGVAGGPMRLVRSVDRRQRVLRVVVTVDRAVINLLLALARKGVGAIEQVIAALSSEST